MRDRAWALSTYYTTGVFKPAFRVQYSQTVVTRGSYADVSDANFHYSEIRVCSKPRSNQ